MRFLTHIKWQVPYGAASFCILMAHEAVGQPCSPSWDNAIGQPGATSYVRCFGIHDDTPGSAPALYVGGNFTAIEGVSANRIARFDGSTWSPLDTGLSARPLVLTVFDDGSVGGPALHAGGLFVTAGGVMVNSIAKWNGSTWSALGTGVTGCVVCPSRVEALAVYDDGTGPALYAGGSFTNAGGVAVNGIAKWNGSTWSAVGTGVTLLGASARIYAMIVHDDGLGGGPALYVGGDFDSAGGMPANRIARWNGTTWTNLGVGMNNPAGLVQSLAVWNDDLYAGGTFLLAGGAVCNNVARWSGLSWSPVGAGTNGLVRALAVFDDGDGDGPVLFAGGEFTQAGGTAAGRIARWTGSNWSSLGSGVSDAVYAMIVHDDQLPAGPALHIGGQFTTAGGATANRIARWQGCPYRWINPVPGEFDDRLKWSNGIAPNESSLVTFGENPGPNGFAVSFNDDVITHALRIAKQRPRFLLNEHTYTASDYVSIGDGQSGVLRLSNGSLISPQITIDPLGQLFADATIEGTITNQGVLQPGLPGGSLTLFGDYVQQDEGIFRASIGPLDVDFMNISGDAHLAGTVVMQLRGGADPKIGESFQIFTADSITGEFEVRLLPDMGADRLMQVQIVAASENAHSGPGGHNAQVGPGSGISVGIGVPDASPNPDAAVNIGPFGQPATGITGAYIQPGATESDIAVCIADPQSQSMGDVVVLLNNGGGTSFTPVVIPVGGLPSGIASAALADGPALDDLAVTRKAAHEVAILFHDGGPLTGSGDAGNALGGTGDYTIVTVGVGLAPSAITDADLNNDSLADLAVANQDSDTVSILLNNGDRTFAPQAPVAVGVEPVSIVAGDFLGSNLNDLVVANSGDDTITVLDNLGGGMYAPSTIPVGPRPIIVNPSDVDNDRDLDIVVSLESGGSLAIIKNLGGGIFHTPVTVPVGGVPGSMDAWDMDGDGDEDIAVVVIDDVSNEPVIRLLRNDTTGGQIAYTFFDPIGEGEDPKLVTGADVNGDKVEDLVTVDEPAPPFNNPGGTTQAGPGEALGPMNSSMSIRRMLLDVEPVCPADIAPVGNLDQTVGVPDLLFIINNWGPCVNPSNCPADLAPQPNGDDAVGVPDLLFIINNWGPCL